RDGPRRNHDGPDVASSVYSTTGSAPIHPSVSDAHVEVVSMVTSGSHVWLKRLLILGTVLLLLAAALPVHAKPGGPGGDTTHKGKHPPVVRMSAHHDVSKPLRSIKVKDHAKPEKARDLPLRKLPRVAVPGLGKKGSGGNTVATPGSKTTAPTSKTSAPAGLDSATSIGSPVTDFIANFLGTRNNHAVAPPGTRAAH